MDEKGRDAHSPWRMPWAAWKAVAVRSWKEASDDNIGLVAAGVAFYGFLALVPLLAAVVLCYGIFADPETVIRHVRALAELAPPDIARTLGGQLLDLVHASDGKKGIGVLFALAVALFGARNGAGAVITALNIAYEEKEKRNFFRVNLTAIAITAAAVIGAVLVAIAVAALGALENLAPIANEALLVLGTVVTYALLTLAGAAGAAALYRFGPSRHRAKWSWISPGSLFTALFWLLITLGFGAYAANLGKFDATYGALGAVAALLTWLYLSAYILLFGAELNSELEHQTAVDTTTGAPQPLGQRRAWVADHVAQGTEAGQDEPEVVERPFKSPPRVPVARDQESFVASRVGAGAAHASGLPRVGWITSGVATFGLALLRRKGRAGPGLALVAAAAGLSWLRRRD
ncbi:YihY/virulence factor BrkB family protein [Sphingomonas sp. MMS12-HWE2-04]|uniref:YihY/virulence factor BrkB family protein n=1 Tax=Sphingomonas sp. MMS12-HWE2-04 TaxID=3234199 RepID=UPI00384BD9F8